MCGCYIMPDRWGPEGGVDVVQKTGSAGRLGRPAAVKSEGDECASGFDVVAHAIAATLDDDRLGVVEQAVE